MTNERIAQSLAKQRLELSATQQFRYYFIVGLLVVFPSISTFLVFENPFDVFQGPEFWVIQPAFLISAFLSYKIQQSNLRLKHITTPLGYEEVKDVIEEVVNKLNWLVVLDRPEVLIAKTPASWASWGEHIVIFFEGENIWATSIMDPDRTTTIMSGGRNRKNIQTLFSTLKRAEEKKMKPA